MILTFENVVAVASVAVGLLAIADARHVRSTRANAFYSILARAHTAIVLAMANIKDPEVRRALADALEGIKTDRANFDRRLRYVGKPHL